MEGQQVERLDNLDIISFIIKYLGIIEINSQ